MNNLGDPGGAVGNQARVRGRVACRCCNAEYQEAKQGSEFAKALHLQAHGKTNGTSFSRKKDSCCAIALWHPPWPFARLGEEQGPLCGENTQWDWFGSIS